MYVILSLNANKFEGDVKRLWKGLLVLLKLGIIDRNEATGLIDRMANHIGKYVKQL
jgi:hypothetical protein